MIVRAVFSVSTRLRWANMALNISWPLNNYVMKTSFHHDEPFLGRCDNHHHPQRVVMKTSLPHDEMNE